MSRGSFIWYDLMTTDVSGAQTFYKSVTGWGTRAFEGNKDYTMWTAAGAAMGGVMALPEEARKMGAPSHWLGFITVDDVDATAAQVPGLGGKIYRDPFDIPTVGRCAILADLSGAVIAIFKPAPSGQDSPAKQGEVGHIGWNELVTADPDHAWTFYHTLFGWEKTQAMDMGPMGTYQLFGHGGKDIGGMMRKPAELPMSAWMYYIRVDNLTAAIERIKAGGGKVVNGPMPVPGDDFIVQGLDPQGGFFALVSHTQ